MLEELQKGQTVVLQDTLYAQNEYTGIMGRRVRRFESYTVDSIFPHQVIVIDRAGLKRGVPEGDFIVIGAVHQSDVIEELRTKRNTEAERLSRGIYNRSTKL